MNFGFILTRHVNSELTNNYWIESYNCIRKIYHDVKIIIIDDNSNYNYISNIELNNCQIIKSEFIGRGELLPYYYFYKNNFFDKAIIIHDSIFIKKIINIENIDNVKFLWHFNSNICDNITRNKMLISQLNNSEQLLILYNNKKLWNGCFGVMSVITFNFVEIIANKYNFFNLLNFIKCRDDRCCLERVFSVVCNYENNLLINNTSIFGDIMKFNKWGYKFNEYIANEETNKYDIIKVWTGR